MEVRDPRRGAGGSSRVNSVGWPRELMPNPSLKRSANGSPPGPVRGAVAFSTARAWRATVGSRLARTLGSTKTPMREALLATRRTCRLPRAARRGRKAPSSIRIGVVVRHTVRRSALRALQSVGITRSLSLFSKPRPAESRTQPQSRALQLGQSRSGCPLLLSTTRRKGSSSALAAARACTERVLPNPSLKASPNSVAHWPSSAGPAAHFALAIQRTTLSGPP